ncbi:MAG: 1-phosphofructokinase family hexose kinase [Abditibacteriaceae bacterium]
MLLFITPNPCIERTYLLNDFDCGKVHRVPPTKVLLNAGGKGINAARVASQFSSKVLSICWVGDAQYNWFDRQLDEENVPHELIRVSQDTRTCINILRVGSPKTEIVEAGLPLSQSAGAQLLERLKVLLPQASLLAVCGSYPPASLDNQLQEIASLAKQYDVPFLVDGKGKSFKQILESHLPLWAIKPNIDEAEEIIGQPIQTPAQERDAIKVLLQYNVQNVLLSCGKRGAYLGNKESITFFDSPQVQEVSAVGSGDSFVGAFCAQWTLTSDLNNAMRYGVAAGAVNASQAKSAFCTKAEIDQQLVEGL